MTSWQMHVIALVLRATRRRTWTSAERARRRMERPEREAPPPRGLRRRHEVTERLVDGFPVWTVRPRTASGTAAVYLHGGAYVSGIAPQHWSLIGRFADAGVRVEVPLYGTAPAHTHRDAYPFLRRVWNELTGEVPGGPVLAGDSAGGGLALGLAQDLVADDAVPPRGSSCSPPGWTSPWVIPGCRSTSGVIPGWPVPACSRRAGPGRAGTTRRRRG